jgi:predicted RNA binding protein YcfA (HicA-like mRNA interferase family)
VRLPRDLSGDELARRLRVYGYESTRQTGSHLRLTSTSQGAEHHLTVPRHSSLRVGTLSAILADVAGYVGLERDEVVEKLFAR